MRIYVSNLGSQITEESLQAIFSAHGEVSTIEIAMDAFTGSSRGFAFVEMPQALQATAAINHINESVIDGKVISAAQTAPKRVQQGSYAVRNN